MKVRRVLCFVLVSLLASMSVEAGLVQMFDADQTTGGNASGEIPEIPMFDRFIGQGDFIFSTGYSFEVPSQCGLTFYILDAPIGEMPQWKYLSPGEKTPFWSTYKAESIGCTAGFIIEGATFQPSGWGMMSTTGEAVSLLSKSPLPALPKGLQYWLGQIHYGNHVSLDSILTSIEGGKQYILNAVYIPDSRGFIGRRIPRAKIADGSADLQLDHAKPFVLVLREKK